MDSFSIDLSPAGAGVSLHLQGQVNASWAAIPSLSQDLVALNMSGNALAVRDLSQGPGTSAGLACTQWCWLQGTLPANLSGLTALTSFDVSSNFITGGLGF